MKRLCLTLGWIYCALLADASHIVGGEFTLKHLRGYRYQLTLNLYFDEVNGNPNADDPSVTVAAYRQGDDQLIEQFTMPKIASNPVSYRNPLCDAGWLRTSQQVYQIELELSPGLYGSAQGSYFVWERCCRNNIIDNIQEPQSTGMVFYLEIPPVVRNGRTFVNNTPEFAVPFGDYACVAQPFTFPFGATDADGDSLRYRLATPLAGSTTPLEPIVTAQPAPHPPVSWRAGFSSFNAIPGGPPLQIDPQTGLLSVTPYGTGLYVFSVICDEYRDGERIGRVQRDFQLAVADCPLNEPPGVTMRHPDDPSNFYNSVDTLLINPLERTCLAVEVTDPNPNSQVSIRLEPRNFPPGTSRLSVSGGIIVQSGDVLTTEFCLPDCESLEDTVHVADLIVSDDGCPESADDTLTVQFRPVLLENESPVLTVDLNTPFGDYTVGDSVIIRVSATDADLDWITLSAIGASFDPERYGMAFEPVRGLGAAAGELRWVPTCENLRFNAGVYDLTFQVVDERCFPRGIDTMSVQFRVRDVPSDAAEFEPTNVFTPNGDGINDAFYLNNLPIDNCDGTFGSITIFDRWGRLIFESDRRDFRWAGTDVAAGTYYFLIHYTNRVYKGYVTLLR